MKFAFTILCTLLVGTLGYSRDAIDLECLTELKLNKTEIEILNNPWEKPTPEDNKDLNDFLECTWKKAGTLKDNCEIHWQNVTRTILKDITEIMENQSQSDSDEAGYYALAGGVMKKAADRCREQNIQGITAGQTVAKVQNCLGQEIKKIT